MVLQSHYDPWLIALSYCVAVSGSYLALRFAGEFGCPDRNAPERPIRAITPAAVILGVTIFLMHFTGMAGLHFDGMAMAYRLDLTVVSLVVAVIFTWIGFASLLLSRGYPDSYFWGGLPMGFGIVAMHYIGVAAMLDHLKVQYDPVLVLLSVIIALVASVASLWLTIRSFHQLNMTGAAAIMGVAICGMHYVGMAAAQFSSI